MSELKDFKRAETLKQSGNKLFLSQHRNEAVDAYNEAIKICPRENPQGRQLYAVLIANRSAVFFQVGEYEKVLRDVAFVKQDGNHPSIEKIIVRGENARKALLSNDEMVPSDKLEFEEDGTLKTNPCPELLWSSDNKIYPALSKKVTIKKNDTMGRFVVATENISVGEIVAVEKPYAFLVTEKQNCGYCAVSTNQIYSCITCHDIYCSVSCLENAKVFHQYECLMDCPKLLDNPRLALRMVTQRSLEKVLEDDMSAKQEKEIDVYKTDDYYIVNKLMGSEISDGRSSCKAIALILCNLLRRTKYFASANTDDKKFYAENVVTELILSYLQIIRFNSHSILEMRNGKDSSSRKNTTSCIGAALYPTVSLFNHSCDPSVDRYNIKNWIVIRSIKPIKAGDVVYDAYRNTFRDTNRSDRNRKLRISHLFTCKCQACVADWPLYEDMDPNHMPELCSCGGSRNFSMRDILIPRPVACSKCKTVKSSAPLMANLKSLDPKMLVANPLFDRGEFDKAAIIYAEIIESLFNHLSHPCGELIMWQDRLEECYRNMGNKNINYKMIYD